MTRQKVTDPALLAQLGQSPRKKVTDPALLAQLNGDDTQENPAEEEFNSHPLRSIAIGLSKLGHSTLNTPYDLVKNLENQGINIGSMINKNFPEPHNPSQAPNIDKVEEFNRKNKVPESLQNPLYNQPFSEKIPHQQNYDFAQILGQKGEPTLMDELIQKGVEYAPAITGTGSLLRGGFRRLIGTHQLDEVRRLMHDRHIPGLGYPEGMINEATNYLPRSHATNQMINQVEANQFQPSMSMQSQVGHHQRNLANSALAADRLLSPRAGELKQAMLGHLQNVMRSHGLNHEADLLQTGINNYRVYKQVQNAVMPVLKKAGIPTTILTALGLGYKISKNAFKD